MRVERRRLVRCGGGCAGIVGWVELDYRGELVVHYESIRTGDWTARESGVVALAALGDGSPAVCPKCPMVYVDREVLAAARRAERDDKRTVYLHSH